MPPVGRNKARVNLTIEPDLNRRWGEITKRLGMTKSGMVEDFLREALPILEEEAENFVSTAFKRVGETLFEIGKTIEGSKDEKKQC